MIAFIVALNQFRPLPGERGLLAFAAAAWLGIVRACLVVTALAERWGSRRVE